MQYKSYQSKREQVWLLVEKVLRVSHPEASDAEIAELLRVMQLVDSIEQLVERIVKANAERAR